jgi:hypothetical protein
MDGTIFHSDHGCQYTSKEFRRLCRRRGITQSMGTVGDCLLTGQYMAVVVVAGVEPVDVGDNLDAVLVAA